MTKIIKTALLSVSLALAGCGDKASTPPATPEKPPAKPNEEKHEHGEGPHGGVIFDFGKHHAEFTVDHAKKECVIYLLKGEDKKAVPLAVSAKELTLTTKPTKTKEGKEVPAMTITLKPADEKDGKATKFTGTDAGLGHVADFSGTVAGEIDGKPSQGEFEEEEHKGK